MRFTSRMSRRRRSDRPAPFAKEIAPTTTNKTMSLTAQNVKGEVNYFLQRIAGGLYVEREEIPVRGRRTLQSVQFSSNDEFGRWCNTDSVRFEHPILYFKLKRCGDDLWRLSFPFNPT